MAALNPFLHFTGNCFEAFQHYQRAFGGEFHNLMRYSEMPGADSNVAASNGIVHIALPMPEGLHLQGSDYPPGMDGAIIGNNFTIVVNTKTEEESRRIFEILCEGGKIVMPLEPTFWSPLYGMCDDKFGVGWMVSMAQ